MLIYFKLKYLQLLGFGIVNLSSVCSCIVFALRLESAAVVAPPSTFMR